MRFASVIFKNLVRRKTRSGLTAGGLAVAVAVTTALLSMTWRYAGSVVNSYAERGVDLVVTRAGVSERATSNLDARLVHQLASLPGVAAADGSLTEWVSFGSQYLIGIPVQGFAPDGFSMAALKIVSGRGLRAGDRHRVLLGTALAKSLGKQPGDRVQIEGTPFDVVGLVVTDNLIDSMTAVALLSDVQELNERFGAVSEIQVRMASTSSEDHDAEIQRLRARIESLRDARGDLLGLKALPTRQFVDSESTLRVSMATAWGTSILAVVLSFVGMLNTMLMSVLERTREFGMLRAVGWRRGRIVRMILGESIVLGLVAAVCGPALGWCLIQLVTIVWPETRSIIYAGLSGFAVLWGVIITIAAGLIGSIYPAYRGATIAPTEALRYE